MIALTQLWLPILLSAVAVFIVSSIIHMVLQWHASDYRGLSNEGEVAAAIRAGSPGPGMYYLPHCKSMKDMGSAEMQEKFRQGPVAKIVLRGNGMPSMGASLLQWFVLCLVVSLLCACLGAAVLPVGAPFKPVFHTIGLAALLAWTIGPPSQGIWFGQPWSAVAKDIIDGILFALATAAVFAWLWPR